MPFLPDRDTGATYGALSKQDYQNNPPADPVTDWSNPLIAPAFCNVAGLTQTAQRVAVQMTTGTSDGYLILNSWAAVWGNITTTAPVLHRVSTGVFTITFPTVVSDEYNASIGIMNNHTVNLTMGWGNIHDTAGFISVQPSANVITVKLTSSGSPSDFAGDKIDIFAL